jgi:hypothetical protein
LHYPLFLLKLVGNFFTATVIINIMVGRRADRAIRWYLDHDQEVAIDVYKAFCDEFVKELARNAEGVTLPLNLGWLKVVGQRHPTEMANEFKKDEAIKDKVVYHKNFHTSGWVFKTYWYSKEIGSKEEIIKSGFFNADIYKFIPSKPLKRAIHTQIMENKWHHWHQRAFTRTPRIQEKRGRPRKVKPTDDTKTDSIPTEA